MKPDKPCSSQSIMLDADWFMAVCDEGEGDRAGIHRRADTELETFPATVPTDVHDVLLKAGKIPDPLIGLNAERFGKKDAWSSFDYHDDPETFEEDYAWVEQKEYWMCTTFEVTCEPSSPSGKLIFHGITMFGQIWLNGNCLGSTANSFVPHSFPVEPFLRQGTNYLAVRLDFGVRLKKEAWRYHEIRTFKYSFGWDWAPRLLNCGLWRPVELRLFDTASLHALNVQTHYDQSSGNGRVDCSVKVRNHVAGQTQKYSITTRLLDADGACVKRRIKNVAVDGRASAYAQDRSGWQGDCAEWSYVLPVDDVHPWLPRDVGEPYCYTFVVELCSGKRVLDRQRRLVGFRTIQFDQTPINEIENHFILLVNNTRVFVRGANWVPTEQLLARTDDTRISRLLEMAEQSNMNMLRVWGGGLFESDLFYDECSRRGIMVWQDFMHACGFNSFFNQDWQTEVERESRAAIKRLRHYPCIALWCGSNETHERKELSGADYETNYGLHLFDRTYPQLIQEEDPGRVYRNSSPYGGDDAGSEEQGDRHVWELFVFPGRTLDETTDYHRYRTGKSKFVSEFGALGSTHQETLDLFFNGEELDTDHPYFKFHGNAFAKKNLPYQVTRYWSDDESLTSFIRGSQFVQGEALKFAIDTFRSNGWHTAGSLYWMFNDCWRTSSGWTTFDYDFRRKLSFYRVREAYAPIRLPITFREDDTLYQCCLRNETAVSVNGFITFGIRGFDGKWQTLIEKTVSVSAHGFSETIPFQIPQNLDRMRHLLWAECRMEQGIVENWCWLEKPRNLQTQHANLHFEVTRLEPGILQAHITSDGFAACVAIRGDDTVPMSDNYSILFPGQEKIITIQSDDPGCFYVEQWL